MKSSIKTGQTPEVEVTVTDAEIAEQAKQRYRDMMRQKDPNWRPASGIEQRSADWVDNASANEIEEARQKGELREFMGEDDPEVAYINEAVRSFHEQVAHHAEQLRLASGTQDKRALQRF